MSRTPDVRALQIHDLSNMHASLLDSALASRFGRGQLRYVHLDGGQHLCWIVSRATGPLELTRLLVADQVNIVASVNGQLLTVPVPPLEPS